jgi:hypothetical protein
VNLDWLECYCLESVENYPHDARYFQSLGYHVVQRDYGTPIYAEMFTIYDRDDHPLIEVRRDPKEWKKPVQQRGFGILPLYDSASFSISLPAGNPSPIITPARSIA